MQIKKRMLLILCITLVTMAAGLFLRYRANDGYDGLIMLGRRIAIHEFKENDIISGFLVHCRQSAPDDRAIVSMNTKVKGARVAERGTISVKKFNDLWSYMIEMDVFTMKDDHSPYETHYYLFHFAEGKEYPYPSRSCFFTIDHTVLRAGHPALEIFQSVQVLVGQAKEWE